MDGGREVLLTEEQVREIQAEPRTRGSGIALAQRFGVSPSLISCVRRRTSYTPAVRGSNRAKLTEVQVRRIRTWPRTYGSRDELAALFGVSPGTITDIRCGKTWSWLDQDPEQKGGDE